MGRFNARQLEIIIQFLIGRDGRICNRCKTEIDKLKTKVRVDHIDGNIDNWDSENLRLLCQSCNVITGLEIKAWLVSRSDKEAPIELRLGSRMEKHFIEWLTGYIEKHKKIEWDKCRNMGALAINGSREVVKNYMKKWTEEESEITPFRTVLENFETYIKYKSQFSDYLLQFEDLK